jgi:hypothetical protein
MTNPAINTEAQAYGTGFSAMIARIIMVAVVGVTGLLSLAMFAG